MEKIKIIKDIGLLGTWFHLSKLINLFTFFVIAKFLSPKDFGLLNLTLGIYFFLMIFPQAISSTVTKFISENKEKEIFSKFLKLTVISAIMFGIAIYFLSNLASKLFSQDISNYLKIISLILFVSSIYEVFKGVFLGLKKVKYFVITELVLYIFNFIFVLFLFLFNFGVYVPLYGLFMSTVLSLMISLILIKKIDFNQSAQANVYDNKKLLNFMYKSITMPILSQATIFVFLYFLTNYRPIEELGYYYFLSKTTIFVLAIFPLALDKVLLPYFSEYYFKKDFVKFQKLSNAYLKFTFYSLLFLSITLYYSINKFIPMFFAEYVGTQKYLFLFILLGAVLAFGTYSSTILLAINKLRIILINNSLLLVMAWFLSYLIVPNEGIWSIGIIHLALYLFTILVYMLFIKKKLNLSYSLSINKKDLENFYWLSWV